MILRARQWIGRAWLAMALAATVAACANPARQANDERSPDAAVVRGWVGTGTFQ